MWMCVYSDTTNTAFLYGLAASTAQIIPSFLHVIRKCEPGLRESLFQQLALLISIVKQHIRSFHRQIFDLLCDYWEENLDQVGWLWRDL